MNSDRRRPTGDIRVWSEPEGGRSKWDSDKPPSDEGMKEAMTLTEPGGV